MKKVQNQDRYLNFYNDYTHNIPVIYSSLEGQYEGELFVDSEVDPQIAILFTPFGFHFVGGNPETDNVVDVLDGMLFKEYLINSGQKEAIVFGPNEKWDKVLNEVFERHHGIKGNRKIFHLNKEKFEKVKSIKNDFESIEKSLIYEKDGGSTIHYPVCRIFKDEKCISFCSGFMLGKGRAEIDVFTEETYQGKGYAKETGIALITELLNKGIEPDWCTWPYRIESQKLALSLGFELAEEISAHIWGEDECGQL